MADSKKEEIEKKSKSAEKSKRENEEPSWYHYVIVLIVMGLLVLMIHYIIVFKDNYESSSLNNLNSSVSIHKLNVYNYTYKEDGKIFNFKFNSPVDVLKNYDVPIEIGKYDLLNSKSITMVFMNYSKNENYYVSTASVKLMRLFKYYFKFNFDKDNFKSISNYSCLNSTLENKVIIFNPYLNNSGIFYNASNGCINIGSNNITNLVKVTDKWMYVLVNS